ncbi:MAG: cobalamin-dependent protein [Deltaproteobacteria bacterium]|nr:cobalamin-dependent protein [Deltaproteobacteria bacterium]
MAIRNVLLIDPPYLGRNVHWWDHVGSHMPGLGLPSLAAWLEHRGHRVYIVDGHVERMDVHTPERLLARFRPDLVGITAMTPVVPAALAVARACRRLFPGVPIVLGGAHPTVLPEDVLAHSEVDFVVRGEGEVTLAELVEGSDPATLAGLSWRAVDGIVHNPDRPLLPDLDALPSPAWHLLPLSRYRPGLGTYRKLPAVSLMTARGCPNRCTYCFNLFGHQVRRQTPTRVVEEVRRLRAVHGIRQIQFYDDTFTLRKDWVLELCGRFAREVPDVAWTCYGRVDTVDADMLDSMARAGCHQICFGVESGDPEVLRTVEKHITIDQVRTAVRLAREAGIRPRGTFMIGNQGETPASMQRTIDLALSLDIDVALFSVATPYPGTAFYRWAEAEGRLVTRDWGQYDRNSTTVRLAGADPETVWAFHRAAYRAFYLRPKFVLRYGLQLRHLRHLWDGFRVLAAVGTYRRVGA